MHRTYDVAQFQEDPHPGADLSAFVIVKGFHQLDIVTKIIERRGDRSYGLTSADKAEKRRYSNGVIFATTLNTDSFAKETCLESNPSFSCDEPFAMSYHTGELIYTAGSELVLLDLHQAKTTVIRHPWMPFLHSVVFSQDGTHVLVASAGFDTLLEIDVSTRLATWEWNAWDNGWNKSRHGNKVVTRNAAHIPQLSRQVPDGHVLLVNDPEEWPREGIPTHDSPIRMNGAAYGSNHTILASAYHLDHLLAINRDGAFRKIALKLMHPHNFSVWNGPTSASYMVTDSGQGKFLLLDSDFEISDTFDFSYIPADHNKKLRFGEWIQNVSVLDSTRKVVAAINALRDGIHIIDLLQMKRRFIATPADWSVQTVFGDPAELRDRLSSLTKFSTSALVSRSNGVKHEPHHEHNG